MKLIDGDKLVKAMTVMAAQEGNSNTRTWAKAISMAELAEEVKVEQTVRCRDCVFCKEEWSPKYEKNMKFCTKFMMPNNISFVSRFPDFGCTEGVLDNKK